MPVKLGDFLKQRMVSPQEIGSPPAAAGDQPSGGARIKDGPTLGVDEMAKMCAKTCGLSDADLDSLRDTEGDATMARVDENEIDLGKLAKSGDAAPVVKLTNVLLVDSLRRGASDIHIEPYEKEFRVRFRIDGILYNVMALPMKLRDPLTQRIKVMARLNVAEKKLPQDGRIRISMRVENRRRDLEFRVTVRPTLWGETIVMRLRDESSLIVDMEELGLERQSLERLRGALSKRYGIVLVTGPQRSGKTNTVYCAIAALVTSDTSIMTAEDPVEFDLPGINQVEVNRLIGESTATVLRSFRHVDADVILASEIPDSESARAAFSLAEQGHLVLSTFHSSDAPTTVARLVSMGIDPYRVGGAVNLIQAQRLVRRVCSHCKVDVSAEVPPRTLIDIGFTPEQVGGFPIMKGKGCQNCSGTGYKGRVGLHEVMEMTEGIRDLIMVGATAVEIKRKALAEGMLTLRMSGLEKIRAGVSTVEEVLRETVP